MNKKYLFRILGMGLFLIGVVLGMVLFGGAAWADLEAAFYGFDADGRRTPHHDRLPGIDDYL